jgi:hypothetical protein
MSPSPLPARPRLSSPPPSRSASVTLGSHAVPSAASASTSSHNTTGPPRHRPFSTLPSKPLPAGLPDRPVAAKWDREEGEEMDDLPRRDKDRGDRDRERDSLSRRRREDSRDWVGPGGSASKRSLAGDRDRDRRGPPFRRDRSFDRERGRDRFDPRFDSRRDDRDLDGGGRGYRGRSRSRSWSRSRSRTRSRSPGRRSGGSRGGGYRESRYAGRDYRDRSRDRRPRSRSPARKLFFFLRDQDLDLTLPLSYR